MNVVIPGGSGQVGTVPARAMHSTGHEVVVLSRRPEPRPWRVMAWGSVTPGEWTAEIDGADVVINLAGRSVNCRYTRANREEPGARTGDATGALVGAYLYLWRRYWPLTFDPQ